MSKKQYPNNITKWTHDELIEYKKPMAFQFNQLMKVWNRLQMNKINSDDLVKLLKYDYHGEIKSEMTRICEALNWIDVLIEKTKIKA